MLADATLPVPASLMTLLADLAPLFTAPSFRTFCGLACGFLAQTGKRTVCGILAGAGLARCWNHDRAHRFFSRARWSPDELGLAVARLVVALLVPAGEPVTVAIDDTLFKRRGKKVWAAAWFHDGSAPGPAKTGYGNNWVVAAVVVRLPAVRRSVAIPVLAKLVIKDTSSASRLWLARRMAAAVADALPGRHVHVVADSAYAGRELGKLPPQVTWTTRLRKDAALYEPPPARTGRRGRPREKGNRLPSLATLAATAAFTSVTVTRYGKTAGDRRQQANLRCRAGPQPHRPRRRAHRTVPARLPGDRRHLVRHRRPRPRRRRRPPHPRSLVHHQGRAIDSRHGCQAPPGRHRRQISGISPRPANP